MPLSAPSRRSCRAPRRRFGSRSERQAVRGEASPCSSYEASVGHSMAAARFGRIRDVWIQRSITLGSRPRGFHLVTDEIMREVPELRELRVGIATLFMQHTSASLTLNENASPDVRRDFAAWFDRAVPDGAPYFAHTREGPDDMAAHLKTSLTGCSLVLPVADGRLALGTWQGIYLCEHRDRGGPRRGILTAFGGGWPGAVFFTISPVPVWI